MLLTAVGCSRQPSVVVGSKNFTEQFILGEILAQQLERRTQLVVQRKFNLGGTLLTQEALVSGALDLYPEYTGTALTAILNQKPSSDAAVFRRWAAYHERRRGFATGFANTFTMTVRGETVRADRLKTTPTLRVQRPWRRAATSFSSDPTGCLVSSSYGLRIKITADHGPRATGTRTRPVI
jgi:glycine betaine/choline ABC-type transport system substrate-binding protein